MVSEQFYLVTPEVLNQRYIAKKDWLKTYEALEGVEITPQESFLAISQVGRINNGYSISLVSYYVIFYCKQLKRKIMILKHLTKNRTCMRCQKGTKLSTQYVCFILTYRQSYFAWYYYLILFTTGCILIKVEAIRIPSGSNALPTPSKRKRDFYQ